MFSQRFWPAILLLGWICQNPAVLPAQTLSPGAGPQQMVANGLPTTYPTTDAQLPVYPSTSPEDPSAAPSYPTTATPGAMPMNLPSYRATTPNLMASVPNRVGGIATSPVPDALTASDYSDLGMTVYDRPVDTDTAVDRVFNSDGVWTWQILPTGLMYPSYLAGPREPRLGTQWVHEREQGWLWEGTIGAKVGLIRYGTENDLWPQGWQWDMEAATFPRLDSIREVVSNDFRVGSFLTTRQGAWEAKLGYVHSCSHLGDEYMIRHHSFSRLNYVRDSIVLGVSLNLNTSFRIYSEADYAFWADDGAKPWAFQFGVDWSSIEPTGARGAPFLAINTQLRQENDFGGNMTFQTGWQWRGRTGHLFRIGMQYFNGMSDQWQFYDRFEEQLGGGIWYDF